MIDYLKQLFELCDDLCAVLDASGKIVECNPNWSNAVGWSEDELKSKPVLDLIRKEDQKRFTDQLTESKLSGSRRGFEVRFLCKNGDLKLLFWSLKFDKSKNLYLSLVKDLSAQKVPEWDLDEVQQLSGIGSWDWNVITNSVRWSRKQYDLFGVDPSTPMTLEIYLSRLSAEERLKTMAAVESASRHGGKYELEHEVIRGDGTIRYFLEAGHVVLDESNKPVRMYGTSQDITEKKLAEQKVAESEQLLASILKVLPVAVFGKDIKKDFQHKIWNNTAEEIFGLKIKDVVGKYDRDFFPSEQAAFFKKKDIEAVNSGDVIDIPEEPANTPSGPILLHTKKVVIKDAKGEPSILLGVTEDITERKRIMNEMLAVKERLAVAIDAVQFGVWDWNLRSGVLLWDDKMYEIYGIKKEDFTGAYDAFEKTLEPNDAQRVSSELQAIFEARSPFFESEFRIISRNKKTKFIKAHAKCFYGSDGKIEKLIGVNYDVTDKKSSEASLVYSAKMASLGEMAGGIAHEINNPLSVILGKVSLFKERMNSGDIDIEKIKDDFTKIEITANRIVKIIRGLRLFSRNSEKDPKQPNKFSQIVQDTLELCHEKFKVQSVELNCDLIDDALINCRPTQISQVLLNLLSNAYDAVCPLSERWVKLTVTKVGKKLIVKVIDRGNGIAPETVAKMMQPFFTTKDIGKGTGLGLSISKGIIEGHDGILFYDATARNTTFVVELPIYDE